MHMASTRMTGIRARPFGYSAPRPPLWRTRESFFTDAGLFLVGAAGLYSVNIIGALPGCELLLIPVFPILVIAQGKRAFDRQYLYFYVMVAAWLMGTLIADAYNDIGMFNRAKGTARVVFFALDFVALAILINNRTRKFIVYVLSYVAVLLIGSRQFSRDFQLQWKFGLSHAFTILALLISVHFYARRKYRNCIFIALFVAGVNFHYGFRSQLLIDLISTVLILPLFDGKPARDGRTQARQGIARTVILLGLAVGSAYMLNFAIKLAAHQGFFDESNNEKFAAQASGDYGVLVGGRPETLVAIQAIRDSPIFGHGSFPYGLKYVRLQQDIQYEHGYSDSDEALDVEYPVIPTHSHLTLAWVEGGILGGICWIYIFVLVLRSVLRLAVARPNFAPLYSYLLCNFLWDILYSPFGSVNRMQAAFFILLSYSMLKSTDSDQPKNPRPMERMLLNGRRVVQLKQAVRPTSANGFVGDPV
jgi:hypothetical protein